MNFHQEAFGGSLLVHLYLIRTDFKTSDHGCGQGAGRIESAATSTGCEHVREACDSARAGPQPFGRVMKPVLHKLADQSQDYASKRFGVFDDLVYFLLQLGSNHNDELQTVLGVLRLDRLFPDIVNSWVAEELKRKYRAPDVLNELVHSSFLFKKEQWGEPAHGLSPSANLRRADCLSEAEGRTGKKQPERGVETGNWQNSNHFCGAVVKTIQGNFVSSLMAAPVRGSRRRFKSEVLIAD
jgi:hypothetical protein